MIKRLPFIVILWAVGAGMLGCASTPPSKFYTLSPTAQRAAVTANYSVALGPVVLPALVDRPQIMVRTGPNQVTFDEFNRWAEPLQENFTAVLAENLAQLLGTDRIIIFPRESAASSDYQVKVTVTRFDGESGGNTVLSTRWSIFAKGGEKELSTKKTDIIEATSAAGYEALVSAQSRAVAKLSKEIAEAIKTVR